VDDTTFVSATVPDPTSVSIDEIPDNITIYQGGTYRLSADVLPALASQELGWNVTNTDDYTISQDGDLYAIPRDFNTSTRVVARSVVDYAIYDELYVSTPMALPTGIEITASDDDVEYGAIFSLGVNITPSYADQSYTVSFDPDDSVWAYDSVNQEVYAPTGDYTVTITVETSNGFTDTLTISAVAPVAETVNIRENIFYKNLAGQNWLAPDSSVQLLVTFDPAGSSADVSWSLADGNSQASLSSTGVYTPNGERQELVDAGIPGHTDEILIVSTYDDPTDVSITGLTSITVGSSTQLGVDVAPVTADPNVSWYKYDPLGAFTMTSGGEITAVKTGSCVVTATGAGGEAGSRSIYATGDSGSGCIDRNTLIPMFNGPARRARSITVDDVLIGYDEVTQTNVPVRVTMVKPDWYKEYYVFNEDLKITTAHPIYTLRNDEWAWMDASEILVGDSLLGLEGKIIPVDTKTFVEQRIDVIAIDVEDIDNYYAGTDPILVHNVQSKE